METIVSLAILAGIIYLIFFRKKSNPLPTQKKIANLGNTIAEYKPTKEQLDDPLFLQDIEPDDTDYLIEDKKLYYKSDGIKIIKVVGMYYRDLNKSLSGFFYGKAVVEDFKEGKLTVAIYNHENIHLGYIPNGNRRMVNSISRNHNGKIPICGELKYAAWEDEWYCDAYIPVMHSNEDIELLIPAFKLFFESDQILKNNNSTGPDLFQILINDSKINEILKSVPSSSPLPFNLPKTLIPNLTTKLEKEKCWELLSELDQYDYLIQSLSELYINSTYKKIQAAKKRTSLL